jgi:hypothetical protein
MLVEIWEQGAIGSDFFILLSPHHSDKWWVENGAYELIPNKSKNEVYIPYTKETHSCFYLGDVQYYDDYNETIGQYRETRQVVSQNKVIAKSNIPEPVLYDEDTIPF